MEILEGVNKNALMIVHLFTSKKQADSLSHEETSYDKSKTVKRVK